MKREIRRVSPLRYAIVLSVMLAILYFVIVVIGLIFGALVGGRMDPAMMAEANGGRMMTLFSGGIVGVVLLPLAGAVAGFIGGLLGGALYNLVAALVGGIVIELADP